MAIENKVQLKTYFETGDKPTQGEFINLIDSFRHVDDGATISLVNKDAQGNITIELSTGDSVSIEKTTIPSSMPISFIEGLQAALDAKATIAELNEALATSAYGIKYTWDSATQRNAQTGMVEHEQGVQKDTREVYRFDGSSWILFYTLDATHHHDDRYYTETESNARFLGKTAKAADADKLDGLDSTAFAKTTHNHPWNQITGVPTTFPASAHNHNNLYYTEAESNARFLGKTAKAADSDKLDGLDSSAFLRTSANNFLIKDTRNDGDRVPNDYEDHKINFQFTDDILNSPNNWDSVITLKGWDDNYAVWQLFSNASSDDRDGLYFRRGRGTRWGSIQKLATQKWASSSFITSQRAISDVLTSTSSVVAASSKAIKIVNDKVNNKLDKTAKAVDADKLDGLNSSQFTRSDADDTFTGKLSVGSTNSRQAGVYGIYDSKKTAHIWSMGTAYKIAANGSNFGNLYGFAYKHTNNPTGGTMAGGHQAVWCNNGVPRSAIGYNGLWTAGDIWANGSYYYGDNKRIVQFTDSWLRLNPSNQFSGGIYCASSILRTDNQLQVGPNGAAFYANSAGDGKFNRNLTVNGNITGKSVNAAYSNLYKFGGLYLTWDSDSYGTNVHHSIRSTYGTTYGDSITMNSFNNIRLNIDSNNNNSNSKFEIGHNTYGTGNVVFTVDERGAKVNGTFFASGNIIAFSDGRLKTDVRPMSASILEKVNQLTPNYYNWKDKSKDQTKQLGFVAQEVQKLFPEWVEKSDDNILGINYNKMGAIIAVKGIQELSSENEKLKDELYQLKQRFQKIETLLN